jgi:flagellar motor switch protein FliN/FliY
MMDDAPQPPKQPSIDDESWMDEMGWGDDAAAPAPAMAMSVPAASPAATPAVAAPVADAGVATAATFTPLDTNGASTNNSAIDLLLDVGLQVTVELGRARMKIGEILALRSGSVIELDRLAGEPADILINGTLIARGEVVVVDEKFGVRIIEVVSRAMRIASLG